MTTREASGIEQGLAGRDMSRPAGSRPASPRPRNSRRNKWRKRLEIAVFTGPALLVFVTFSIVPVILAARYSFYNWNGIEALDDFIGLDNYKRALADPIFLRALRNNIFFVFLSIVVQLPIALTVALIMNRKMKGRSIFRMLIFVPYVVSEVIAGVMWLLILQPRGLIDALFDKLGLSEQNQLWLADQNVVVWTVLFVISWKYVGLAIILFLAGLQNVPQELEEAAQIDGATWWQIQRRIKIPLLAPTMRIWVFLSMIGSLQLFDMVWIMTGGGPGNASATMATYMIKRGFQRSQYGYGSAVAVILFFISLVAALVYMRFVLRRDNESPDNRREA